MKLLLFLFINSLSVLIASRILPGISVENTFTVVMVAVILGLVNTFLKPILIILTLPLNIMTLGLFTLAINGILVILTTYIVPGFYVENFFWAILFSLVITVVSSFLNKIAK